jgi:phosphoribosylanthranilate isomerase
MMPWPVRRADGTALIKMCGMRREEDVDAAINSGADLLGLVFAPSRRQVSGVEGRRLVEAAAGRVPVVGVFVDRSAEEINKIVASTGISIAQLSGSEASEEMRTLTVPYIKTVHVKDGSTVADLLHIINSHRGAAAFCVDTWSPLGGGSGRVSDWTVVRAIVDAVKAPVIVAGGLTAQNAASALIATGAAGVDVSSGVEVGGWKDRLAMQSFVEKARALHLHVTPIDASVS